jgi:hypothetical protein
MEVLRMTSIQFTGLKKEQCLEVLDYHWVVEASSQETKECLTLDHGLSNVEAQAVFEEILETDPSKFEGEDEEAWYNYLEKVAKDNDLGS